MKGSLTMLAATAAAIVVAAPAAAAPPVVVTTSLAPAWLYFADAVVARVDVVFDPRRVDPNTIQVNPSFGKWQQLAPVRISTTRGGGLVRRSWSYRISCFAFTCVPRGTQTQVFRLPRLTVTARSRTGSLLNASRPWPSVDMAGRFLPPALGTVRPEFRLENDTRAATYRLSPTSLAFALDAIGAVALALAVALVGREIVRVASSRRNRVDERPPLVRALALVREAETRGADDRRRAAGLLARALPPNEDTLSGVASEVAWSMPQPSSSKLEELAQAVESEFEESP
jgi:hypothetical protein